MPYVLRILDGDHKGQYIGRKGIRGWDRKIVEDINDAAVFASISGIKCFHGQPTNAAIREEIAKRSKEIRRKIFGANISNAEINSLYDWPKIRRFRRLRAQIVKELAIPYTDRYEAIEIEINKSLK